MLKRLMLIFAYLLGSQLFANTQIIKNSLSVNAPNVYSPTLIVQGETLVMYYGGWSDNGQTQDNIYRAECYESIARCEPPAKVMDSTELGFQHLNDPTIIQMPQGHYLMYMTGVPLGSPDGGTNASSNSVYYSVSSFSDAGIRWTAPRLIASDLWMPSATLDAQGEVLLYGNSNTTGQIIQYNLGTSGISVKSIKKLNAPKFYLNVDISYRPSLRMFEILAEVMPDGKHTNQIDYLVSSDGINWALSSEGIIQPRPGALTVRTPTSHPLTNRIVYDAETSNADSTANKIYAAQWQITPNSQSFLMSNAFSNDEVLPANNAIDLSNENLFYSSHIYNSATPSINIFLAAWMPDFKIVNSLNITARMDHNSVLGFPSEYDVYVTSPDNKSWNYVGTYSHQPDSSGKVVIAFNGPFYTTGAMIVPKKLGKDSYGGHYFQIENMSLGVIKVP